MDKMTFPTWPQFAEEDIGAVADLLRSGRVNYWTGPEVRGFEDEYARHCEVPHATALANGTLALQAGLLGLGLQPGDEVIVTPRTFIASASVIALAGGVPVFADVDPDTQNLDPARVAELIGPRTVGIIAVHHAGWPCDMRALMALADKAGLWILEDCAQAHGAQLDGRPVGSFGDAAAFSFCQDKIISTGGEGGMLLCRDDGVWKRAWSFKDHGKDFDAVQAAARDSTPGVPWVHRLLGSNWRMAGVQAAIGRVQLRKLEAWHAARLRNAMRFHERLSSCPALRIPMPSASIRHAFYRFYVFVRPERLRAGSTRNDIVAALQGRGVPCNLGSCSEIYLEEAFKGAGFGPSERLPVAQSLGETSIALLVHPTLESPHIDQMADAVLELMSTVTD